MSHQLTSASLWGWSTKVEDINQVSLIPRWPALLLRTPASLSIIKLLLLLLLVLLFVWPLLAIPLLVGCTLWWLTVRVLLLKAATCTVVAATLPQHQPSPAKDLCGGIHSQAYAPHKQHKLYMHTQASKEAAAAAAQQHHPQPHASIRNILTR
jgi:hypothetical protein